MSGERGSLFAARLFGPMCRQYGHLFIRDSFFGLPIGKPYCMRCGKRASS